MSIDLKIRELSCARASDSGLLELMPMATVSYDGEGRVLRTNPGAAELFEGDPGRAEFSDEAAGPCQVDRKPLSPIAAEILTGKPQRETGGWSVKREFGTELLERGVARELVAEATLQFLPAGVVCDIEALLP
ncbi:MAG: hypothetical protein JO288_22005 [Hyphomicrobiales bacterium]|nr:hypothetical protein [Hyphomicrobiales bacterium]